jgi:hypothetical protein
MTNKSLAKIVAPIVGVAITGAFGYGVGANQSRSLIEVANINANSNKEIALINAQKDLEITRLKLESVNSKIDSVKTESANFLLDSTNLSLDSTNIKQSSFIDFEAMKEFFYSSFEHLTGGTLFFGSITSLFCIICLIGYVTLFRLKAPIEDNYSGYTLKFLKFLEPFSTTLISFYLSILVSIQIMFLILSISLLSK